MDQDTTELIAQLATKLGIVLEDAAPVALALGARDDSERALVLAYLGEAIANAGALHAAIAALSG